jgi:lysophospholipase L1-like esterase
VTRNALWFVALGSAATLAVGVVVIGQLRDDDANVGPDSIVVLGDSITAQGDWASLLPDWPIVNRGFPGYTSAELVPIAREVGAARPSAVVVLAGTNDIRDGRDAAWTATHLNDIVDRLQEASPDTVVVLQTLLPRRDAPDAVRRANEVVAGIVQDRGLRLLDLYTPFDDGSGALRTTETTDGVHLSEAGYARWAALIEQELGDLLARATAP